MRQGKGHLVVDFDTGQVTVHDGHSTTVHGFDTAEAFAVVSEAWLRVGWDVKYVYSFTWMGRPIIQLPEDVMRIQELIYFARPDLIIETGVAHGGSLMLYASLLSAMGGGRVIGIDVEIRPHNRRAIENHELASDIALIEGSSTDSATVDAVARLVQPNERVLVILDSNHTKDHVLAELRAYSRFVTSGSYLVVADGIMAQVAGAPRTQADWLWNNPLGAIDEFLGESDLFESAEPPFAFNEGLVADRVTYWPRGFLRRR